MTAVERARSYGARTGTRPARGQSGTHIPACPQPRSELRRAAGLGGTAGARRTKQHGDTGARPGRRGCGDRVRPAGVTRPSTVPRFRASRNRSGRRGPPEATRSSAAPGPPHPQRPQLERRGAGPGGAAVRGRGGAGGRRHVMRFPAP